MNLENLKQIKDLSEKSKNVEVLSDKQLSKALEQNTFGVIPRNGGEWSGEPGNSKWIPDRDDKPKNKSYSNIEDKTWGQILDENGVDGIQFNDGEPDFSEVSRATVEIDNFSDARYGIGGNFDQADAKVAQERGCTKQEVTQWRIDNNCTWHECSDCKTMNKVSREIHGNISHSGGISKITNA